MLLERKLVAAVKLPCQTWLRGYDRSILCADLIAASIVTVMLIPQSLAYALLAGLPAEVGLYASVLPLIAYALFGSSRTLSVGPVAVVSLMSAAAIGSLGIVEEELRIAAAVALAMLCGLVLLLMGLLKLGALANFISHPVISGFISAAGILIALSQLKHLLGVDLAGHSLFELGASMLAQLTDFHSQTLLLGTTSIALLLLLRRCLQRMLLALGVSTTAAALLAKIGPALVVVTATVVVWAMQLHVQGVAVVGEITAGLPSITLAGFDPALWRQLAVPAVLICLVGFVESVSVAQTLAAKRRQRIDPNSELVGLGSANIASALSGGFAVTGGFSRSVVNFDAGAQTPAAGVFTALAIALVALFLTPLIYFLPLATLAATIIVAVLSLVDLRAFAETWRYSRTDFCALCATFGATLLLGVELGILAGVGLSIALHLQRTSKPHSAVVGHLEGSEHFRNVERHSVLTSDQLLTLRVDESLYFANARFLEDRIYQLISTQPSLRHLVLMCSAVNHIDASALHSLLSINDRLAAQHIQLHLSEVKGPVMDRLQRSSLLAKLTGSVYLSQYDAWQALCCASLDRSAA